MARPAKKIRYAVVGLGHIAQVAVLPGFRHAAANSQVSALVSDEPEKLRRLGRLYGACSLWDYGHYDELMKSGGVDAVYLAMPNHLHRNFAMRAAAAGVHVLCEKPMAVTEAHCREMLDTARRHRTLLMIAYRLHFDPATLKVLGKVRKGAIGRPRLLHASLSIRVQDPKNIRLNPLSQGGGPLYDLGIYCINAARQLFAAEPVQVSGFNQGRTRQGSDAEVTATGLLRFPGGELACLACSLDSAKTSEFNVVGETGQIRLEGAFDYAAPRTAHYFLGSKYSKDDFPATDQFGPELLYFSDCILKKRQPQPSGLEGLADVRVIQALHHSAATGRSVVLSPLRQEPRRAGREARRYY